MNKITKKYATILFFVNPGIPDKELLKTIIDFNNEKRKRKRFYQSVIKKKLGKAKKENGNSGSNNIDN